MQVGEAALAALDEVARGPVLDDPAVGDKAIKQGGIIIHEVGGAIMGDDPAKSVTNSFGQCWDMKNLFITDGATLCSNADKNPTLTIMALAWRASDHMLGLMMRKEL
jgi:choline dehydrogenase-like flavoprotein